MLRLMYEAVVSVCSGHAITAGRQPRAVVNEFAEHREPFRPKWPEKVHRERPEHASARGVSPAETSFTGEHHSDNTPGMSLAPSGDADIRVLRALMRGRVMDDPFR